MAQERLPMFVGVDTVKYDLGVSRAKAYEVIKDLNRQLKAQNPRASRESPGDDPCRGMRCI